MSRLIKISVNLVSISLGLCVAVSLTSCKNLPDTTGTQVIQLDNRKIENYVRRHEQATYTLVFESGAMNCIQRWGKVLLQLPTNVNVYAYNRPGYCNSSTIAAEPNSHNIARELRLELHRQELKPPYVLIGHSIGGLYIQQFAREYPNEVHGLVLVDAMYPGLLKNPSEFPWYTNIEMKLFLSKTVREEINLAYMNGLMIDALPTIDDKPIVRMFNVPKGKAIAVDFGAFNQDEKTIAKVRNMYPNAKIVVADSSHQMQETSPELVIQAINDVMQAQGALQ